ncbi:MAG: restriction endonuclease subunit S [Bacteroides sp.]|nr:restriction endonuclease subunit S [Bacteroides sp.]
MINHYYNLEKIVDVESLDAFQESVLAYPVISIITNSPNKRVVEIANVNKLHDLNSEIRYKSRCYAENDELGSVFYTDYNSNFPTIEEQNYSIGIGVATGADRVFISDNLTDKIEPELLVPIIRSKDLSNNRFQYGGLYLLNPYDQFGRLIDLDHYPKAKFYLEQNKTVLQNRHIVKNNRSWYALIDKIKPDLLHKSKILLPDISANSYVFVDTGNFYPSHNIYYITSKSGNDEDLFLLASFLMSNAVRNQLLSLSNKMNGGFPRWQSQVLKKLRIPYISGIKSNYKKQLLSAYEVFDIGEINRIVNKILNLQSTTCKHSKSKIYPEPSLFDATAPGL